MNKIRVIDLLNKIANGEVLPNKISYYGDVYIWNSTINEYESIVEDDKLLFCEIFVQRCLHDKIEILDQYYERCYGEEPTEDPPKIPEKIEQIGCHVKVNGLLIPTNSLVIDFLVNKQNEIIDYLESVKK